MQKRVLLVDDEYIVRKTLQDFLEDEGFYVGTAESGENGIDLLREAPFDYCIVDMRLPGMDGNDFILGAHGMDPGLRFLVYTGSVDYVPPAGFRDFGITRTHIFHKPIADMRTLSDALRRLESEAPE